jgi:hypothetical protein
MLSPRDIYPPEWFNESSTDELVGKGASGKGKKKQPGAPKYTVRQLVSGCRVLQISCMPPTRLHVVSITHPAAVEVCMSVASTSERRKAPARHTLH